MAEEPAAKDIEISRTDQSREEVGSPVKTLTGYMHPLYAESLAEFGIPRLLPRSGGWILVRQIQGSSHSDAMGPYPLFACVDWSQLHSDLENLENLVSLSLVADPFGGYDLAYLRRCFDVVIPFKEHFVIDVSQPVDRIVSKSHRATARRALRKVNVEWCPDPTLFLDEWMGLFAFLVKRHKITGIRAFTRTAFAKQLRTPGMVLFRAVSGGITVGLDSWYVQGQVAYGHLAAYSPLGYELSVSYALKWYIIHYFADKVRWIDLAGGAGVGTSAEDGLTKFKRGWATGTRPVYICGRILDHQKYSELVKGIPPSDYFPAYRKGEFA